MNFHFARGPLFENLVVLELMKKEMNAGNIPSLYFWRDSNQNEVDFLQEKDGNLISIEIKSSETYHSDFLKGLKYFQKIAPESTSKLIYAGNLNQEREGIQISNYWNL